MEVLARPHPVAQASSGAPGPAVTTPFLCPLIDTSTEHPRVLQGLSPPPCCPCTQLGHLP